MQQSLKNVYNQIWQQFCKNNPAYNLKQNKAQSTLAELTHKGVN